MRTTITIDDKLLKQLKKWAIDNDTTVSSYVQQAVIQQMLEDAADGEEAMKRMSEPTVTHEELVRQMKEEGLL